MVESLEDRLLLRAVLMPRDCKPIAGPDQLSQKSYDEAIKLFEPASFPGRGRAIPRKAAWGGATDALGYFKFHSNSS